MARLQPLPQLSARVSIGKNRTIMFTARGKPPRARSKLQNKRVYTAIYSYLLLQHSPSYLGCSGKHAQPQKFELCTHLL